LFARDIRPRLWLRTSASIVGSHIRKKNLGEQKMLRIFVTAVTLTALVTPALADYWVVQDDPTTHKCSIVDQKPGKGRTELYSFKTQQEAQAYIQKITMCGGGSD
jgi:hypothetical protein